MPILKLNGEPYPALPPTKRSAEATSMGAREQIFASVARGMTPATLARVLDAAAQGDIEEYLTMAEEMEERDLHYFSLISTRKLALTGSPRNMEPFDDSSQAQEIAEACENLLVNTPVFAGMMFDLLDALAKGFACVQPVWDTTTRPWTYREFFYTDPRWFTYDTNNVSELLLKTDARPTGVKIPPGKFVIHKPKIKSGLAIRGGLARMAAITAMLKGYTMKDWLAFMEVFGMPTRIGKYDPSTVTDREKSTLLSALRGLGHDAAAMIPEGMEIELLDAKRPSGGDSLFGGLADYLDKQMSKGILGQTMTSDNGGSLAQAKVHQMVRQDILDADSEQLEATINAQIIAPWVAYNYGVGAPVPRLKIKTEPPEDLTAFTSAVLPWVEKAGLEVESDFIREKFGVPEPKTVETQILGTPPEEPEPTPVAPGDPAGPPPGGEVEKVAKNAALPQSLQRAETSADDMAGEWERELGPHKDALDEIAKNATGYDDFLLKLRGAEKDFDSDMFVRRLALEMAKVRGLASA